MLLYLENKEEKGVWQYVQTICLYLYLFLVPDAPYKIQVTNQTTQTLGIQILHGHGVVQSFIVQVNDSFCLKINSSNSSPTFVLIPGLIPGYLYRTIKIQAQSNDLKSIGKYVPVHGTSE